MGSDQQFFGVTNPDSHFNPRSPCGERHDNIRLTYIKGHFNPRSPCGERLLTLSIFRSMLAFQSTLPVWGATPEVTDFAPTSPRKFQSTLPVWGATARSFPCLAASAFQSTLPVWGATGIKTVRQSRGKNFNPRSPCGERPMLVLLHL